MNTGIKAILSDYRKIHLSEIPLSERKHIYKLVTFVALALLIFFATLTITPLILALLFPIHQGYEYNALYGIFHGLTFIENEIIKFFDNNRLLMA